MIAGTRGVDLGEAAANDAATTGKRGLTLTHATGIMAGVTPEQLIERLGPDLTDLPEVTPATQAVCDHILAKTPVAPLRHYVESNLSGDKKASAKSFTSARGRKVTAEARLSADLVAKHLHTTPQVMAEYWRMSAIGVVSRDRPGCRMRRGIGDRSHAFRSDRGWRVVCGRDASRHHGRDRRWWHRFADAAGLSRVDEACGERKGAGVGGGLCGVVAGR